MKKQADKTKRGMIMRLRSSILRCLADKLGVVKQVLILKRVRFVYWERITVAGLVGVEAGRDVTQPLSGFIA